MKKLYLVRHASSRKKDGKTDYTRTLNKRGEQDAETLASNLKKESDFRVDSIISSPAIRAFETALIFADRLGLSEDKIELKDSLFNLESQYNFIDSINSINDSVSNVLLVGHNPSVENTAGLLIDGFRHNFYSCSALCIEFNVDSWKQIVQSCGKFVYYKFNRFNPNLSKLDKIIALSVKNEIYSKIETSLKEIETELISADLNEGEYAGEKLADRIYQKTDIITIRSISALDDEIKRYEQQKAKKIENKIQELNAVLNKYNEKAKIKNNKKIAVIEKRKNKLISKIQLRQAD